MSRIVRLSSNTTLFWKIFLPTFWFVFYGAATIAVWFTDKGDLGIFATPSWKYGITSFYLLGSVVIYFTVLQLKRVEYEDGVFYVSNYFRTLSVPAEIALRITTTNLLIAKTANLQLKQKTLMGRNIHFLIRRSLANDIRDIVPDNSQSKAK